MCIYKKCFVEKLEVNRTTGKDVSGQCAAKGVAPDKRDNQVKKFLFLHKKTYVMVLIRSASVRHF